MQYFFYHCCHLLSEAAAAAAARCHLRCWSSGRQQVEVPVKGAMYSLLHVFGDHSVQLTAGIHHPAYHSQVSSGRILKSSLK